VFSASGRTIPGLHAPRLRVRKVAARAQHRAESIAGDASRQIAPESMRRPPDRAICAAWSDLPRRFD
jgi:hypothetical protein